MQLTKHGHACVVLSDGDRRLLVDPGSFTADDAWAGASALLVTHEHLDHFMPDKVRAAMAADPALELWTNSAVAGQLEGLGSRVHAVGPGDTFTAAGLEVSVHGEWHAVIHPDIPRCATSASSSRTPCSTPATHSPCRRSPSRRCCCRPTRRGRSSPS